MVKNRVKRYDFKSLIFEDSCSLSARLDET